MPASLCLLPLHQAKCGSKMWGHLWGGANRDSWSGNHYPLPCHGAFNLSIPSTRPRVAELPQPPHSNSESKIISRTEIAEPWSQHSAWCNPSLWDDDSGAQGNGGDEKSELRGTVPGTASIVTLWHGKSVGLGCAWVDAMEGGENINFLVYAPPPPPEGCHLSEGVPWASHYGEGTGMREKEANLSWIFTLGTVQGRPPLGSSEEPMCFLSSESQHFTFLTHRGNSGQSGLYRITVTPTEKWWLPHLTTEGNCNYNWQGRGKAWKGFFFLFSLHPTTSTLRREEGSVWESSSP